MALLTNVFILSNDIIFRTSLLEELSRDRSCFVRPATDVISAAQLLVKNDPNVMIIDVTTQNVTDAYLYTLVTKFNLAVFIVKAAVLVSFPRTGVKDYFTKPIANNALLMKNMCADMMIRIKAFEKKSPPPTFSDFRDAVGENDKLVFIAASTGGTEALPVVIRELPAMCPPVLIVQHMPPIFTSQFADRLDRLAKIRVKEAADGDYLKKGLALLAPGDFHMKLVKRNSKLAVVCETGEKVHGVRPSADVLFLSAVPLVRSNTLSVILTGMGVDGANGMLQFHQKGGKTIGQNRETCVVYGMPKAAFDLGAIDYELPLDRIGKKIAELI